jgi:hypothetical protein
MFCSTESFQIDKVKSLSLFTNMIPKLFVRSSAHMKVLQHCLVTIIMSTSAIVLLKPVLFWLNAGEKSHSVACTKTAII